MPRRQHCPDLATHQGAMHIALVVPIPRAPTPAPAPIRKGSALRIPVAAIAEAVTRPPPTMMAAGSTPGQLLAHPAKMPFVSMQ